MASCTPPVITFPTGIDGKMDVINRYNDLMKETMGIDSLYTRTKDTFYELFKDLEIDQEEKAQIVAKSMSDMAIQMSSSAMQSAVLWAKEERDGEYTSALLYAQTMKAMADGELAKSKICESENQIELICAKVTETISSTFRENGMPSGMDGCKPTGLMDEGLKYEQTQMVIQQTDSMEEDDIRKNAKNCEDIMFSERQRASFEDSKRNHAANAASQMISGLIASEIGRAGNEDLINYWTQAMQYLTNDSPPSSGCTLPGSP